MAGGVRELHDRGARLSGAAFGGVDDAGGGFGEVALELFQIGEHLVVGVDVSTIDVLHLAEDRAVAGDALPFLHFQRGEAAEFGGPGAVHGDAGRVIAVTAEREVLADEDDRVAAEPLSEIEGEVHDGRACLKRRALGKTVADAAAGEGVVEEDEAAVFSEGMRD